MGTKFELQTDSRDDFLKRVDQLNPKRVDSAQEMFWEKVNKAKNALARSNVVRKKYFRAEALN